MHEGGVSSCGFLFGIWCIFIFLPLAVSMEICICLVGEAQRPAECVSTVNIDHNTIYWVRCNGQLTPGGRITMETCTKQTLFPYMYTGTGVTYKMPEVLYEVCWRSAVQDLVASSGEVADCNQLYTPSLILPFKASRRIYSGS